MTTARLKMKSTDCGCTFRHQLLYLAYVPKMGNETSVESIDNKGFTAVKTPALKILVGEPTELRASQLNDPRMILLAPVEELLDVATQ